MKEGNELSINTPESKDKKAELDQFGKNRSKTLIENPKAKLDHYNEIYAYLTKLDPKYRDRIIELASQRPPMEKECGVSICIPVAGHQEEKNIYETLKNYTYQTAKKENFEIVLFVNHPEKDQNGNPLNANATLDEIERFKNDYPELKIRVMYEALPNEEAKIGKIRKLLADATLVAQHERGKDAPDLIMISNDADNKGIDPKYIETFLAKFESNPQMDGCLGQLDWDPESYQKFPVIHFGTRLFQYLNIIGRHRSGGMVSSGGNSAFRSSIYAGIGGYMDSLSEGEDVAIGQAIIAARGNDKSSFGFAGAKTRLFTSSRRAINALYSGLAPVEQWEKGFSAFDDKIRKMGIEKDEIVDYGVPELVEQLKELLEHVINRTLDVYEAGERLGKDSSYYRKALGWMGVKYTLDTKGDVVITDMDPIIQNLKKYQIEGQLMQKARSGNSQAKDELKDIRKTEKILRAKEEKTREDSFQKKLKKFLEENTFNLEIAGRAVSIDDLRKSLNKTTLGDYVIANDFPLTTEDANITLAYKNDSEKILVVKEITEEKNKKLAELHNWGNTNPEEYLIERKFDHPNVLLPKKIIKRDGKIYRFYEAMDIDLEKYLLSHNKLPLKESLSLILRVCDGIEALHRAGIVNIDLSPSNIMLIDKDLKIIDLDGVAINKNGGSILGRNYNSGNRFTSSPELFTDRPRFDKTVDIYAVASTLYRLLVGDWPYNIEKNTIGFSAEEKRSAYKKLHEEGKINFPEFIPLKIQKAIKKGMNPNPKARYQSMQEFMSELIIM